ncbi:MAG: DUF2393 family protein [Sulfurimonas sp.]|uniref:DUF2393 family protein n=1 Tax=Sulfurimonas sp. TaxID=2022749 RepID=UPI0025DC84E4|nr:DUF2393 family protein [Sulfurimonas sp.]MCK9455478.1 DUF2393 domain-containing protein [Sulfurimonas sp.]
MITLFNEWHYIALAVILLILIGGIALAFKKENFKIRSQIIFSTLLITSVMAGFSILVVDKYTKIAKLYKLENKRNLSTEEIMYSGVVKNEGKHKIGKVIFEIKLVNKGHISGNVKAGSFYKPSGFFDFFSGGSFNSNVKVQQITHEFVVAKDLIPGESREFRVYFAYPPHFRGVTQFSKLYAH